MQTSENNGTTWDPDTTKSTSLLTNVHKNTARCVWAVREDTDLLMQESLKRIGSEFIPVLMR